MVRHNRQRLALEIMRLPQPTPCPLPWFAEVNPLLLVTEVPRPASLGQQVGEGSVEKVEAELHGKHNVGRSAHGGQETWFFRRQRAQTLTEKGQQVGVVRQFQDTGLQRSKPIDDES